MSDIYTNPWNLTKREVETMDAMVEHYSIKRAANATGVAVYTLNDHIKSAVKKMKCEGSIIQKYLLWDRFRQQQQREQVIASTEHN